MKFNPVQNLRKPLKLSRVQKVIITAANDMWNVFFFYRPGSVVFLSSSRELGFFKILI